MRIIFVMGPSCAGKSYYIKNNLKDFVKVDLYDFQEGIPSTPEAILQSYEDCKERLIEEIKKGNDVVLEHTLLKAIRREVYINAVKEVTDTPIEAVWIFPDCRTLRRNAEERCCYFIDRMFDDYVKVAEVPTTKEGFSNVTIIT